jgi:hypothetical protein
MHAPQPRQLHNGCCKVNGIHAAHMSLYDGLQLLCCAAVPYAGSNVPRFKRLQVQQEAEAEQA